MREIDPRLGPLLQGESPLLRFIAIALCAAMPPAALDEVFGTLSDRGADPNQLVAGHRFHYWQGKSPDQVRAEGVTDEQFQAIAAAHAARGIPWAPAPVVSYAEVPPPAPEPLPPAPVPAPAAVPIPNAAEPPKPDPLAEFAIAGYRLSELAGKSDAELLAMPRIGRATIARIREAEAAAKQ